MTHLVEVDAPVPAEPPYRKVVTALVSEFGTAPVELIEQCVASEVQRLQDARVTTYLAILVERASRERVLMAWPTTSSRT